MAEKKKQPLSLNQRHNRLLQDLSASQSRPHPKPPHEDEPSKVKLDSNDDVPRFFGIADFDSPSAIVQMKPSTSEAEVEEKPSEVKIESKVSLDVPMIAKTTNLNSHFEEEKKLKVRMQGRRRLCKVSNGENDGKKETTNDDDLVISGINDFDSPPALKNAVETVSSGGSEIRDILNDLSSRLEFLSIEKKRAPKTVDLTSVKDGIYNLEKKENVPEYASAASSFSITSDPSDSSSNATSQSVVESWVDNYEKENDLENEQELDNFLGRVSRPKNAGKGQKKNATERVSRESVPVRQTYAAKFEVNDDEEDDCVILSGKKMNKEVDRRGAKFQERFDDSDRVDALVNYNDDSVSRDENCITLRGPKLTFVLPGKIASMLYPHQRDGLNWLWSLHCQGKGGILGDDMGLGKTMQICGFLAGLFHSCLIKRALVVAPKTLLPHWIKELSAVGLSEKTREYFGTCAKARQYELQYILQDKGVLLTTYDIVRNNAKSLRGDCYFNDERIDDDITWDYMILDEGHLIKNPSTQRAKSLLEIPAAHRIVISGTPIQNNLKELWALFYFCCPELLGDKNWFKEKYEYAILRGNDKNASDRDKRIGSTVAKDLRERIQPYFLRRLKSEVFHEDDTSQTKLSTKNEIIVWLKLTSCQRQLYEAFLKSELVLSAFDGSPLAALTILKKICDHPLLLTKRAAEDVLEGMDSMLNQEDHIVAEKLAMHIADESERSNFEGNHDNVSCKISFILSLLDNLISEGHCVLIFSQTRKMLNLIQESLVAKGYEFLRIDGATKASDRVKIVNDFQEGIGAPIFLLTSQVGGLGLTLTKADRVIVVDPAWNPSTDNQSVDRAYRIGQKKDVIVYRLMTCGTIEEKIYRKQIYKGGLFKSATEHKEQTRYFSQQDLQELFSLPKQGFDISLTQQQLHEEHDRQHTMNEYLKSHIRFLETQGIAGVSHHSLLFSKTAPVPVVQEEEEVSIKRTTFMGNSSSSSHLERDVDGSKYAFNPKDVKLYGNSSSMCSVDKPTEKEIKDRMNRLSQLLANKVLVSKLPDKGENIQKQIGELKLELDMIHMAKGAGKEVINLDDISGKFKTVLNV